MDPKVVKKIKDNGSLSTIEYDKLTKADVKVKKNFRPTLKVKSMNFEKKEHLASLWSTSPNRKPLIQLNLINLHIYIQ